MSKTSHEQELENALINTYTYNLRFLSEYDKQLFQRVSMLSDVIGNGQYSERYFLEFVKENKEFDIYDSHHKKYVYDKKPKQWNNKAVLNSNFDLENSINLLNPDVYEADITDLSDEKDDLISINRLKVISDIKNYKNIKYDSLYNKKKKVKNFNKFIFVGTLLGRHIPKIIKKLNTINHFVCEANLEIFRLSLFVCDYSLLARDGKSVVFSIMEEEQEFYEKFNKFFKNHINENVVYKYYSTNYNISNYFDRLINGVLDKDPFSFDYNLILNNIVNLSTKNFNKYKTLNFSQNEINIFEDKNILFLGAGPSLGQQIDWIKENQNKFIIVSMGAAVSKLIENGINPDIITTIDPREIIEEHFAKIDKLTLDNIVKIAALNSYKKVFDIFESNIESLYTFEGIKSFQKDNIAIDGISVGEVTFKILLLLRAKNIFLLGLDLALDQKTGLTHIDTHVGPTLNKFDIKKDIVDNESMMNKSFSLREDTISIKGNFYDKVTTTRLFYVSLLDYNQAIKFFKTKEQTIYNLSENGVYIENTIPLKIKDVNLEECDILDKKELHKELKMKLDEISVESLKKIDQENIIFELEQLENVIEVIGIFGKSKIKTYEQFKKELEIVIKTIFSIESYSTYLPEIFINFHFIINRYIDFVFNDRQLKHDTKNIKDIQYIWSTHVLDIVLKYQNYIRRLISQK